MTGGGPTLARILAGLPAELVQCEPSWTVGAVVADSRAVRPGDAFLARPGQTHDGHRFAAAALERGAKVVIVQRGAIEPPAGPHVWLPDTRAAEAQLAANAFDDPAASLALAGITGTNGKTTTAHLVGAILREAGILHARLGTTGNWILDREEAAAFTTPFPLELQALLARTRDGGGRAAVMEVSSHALAQGRIDPLVFQAVGLTSFSQDHLDFHGSMEAYLEAKLALVRRHVDAGSVAVAAVDGHPAAAGFLATAQRRGARAWRASRGDDPRAELRAEDLAYDLDRTRARVQTPAGPLRLSSPLIAAYNLDNLLVAIGLAVALGVELEVIERGLATARGAPGRLERVEMPAAAGPTVVVDYAHTPDAVERALQAVRPLCRGRLVVVLGCGGDRDAAKRPLMAAAASRHADLFYATSDNPRTEDPERILDQVMLGVRGGTPVVREVDRARAIAMAIAEAGDLDLVLVAGKGHEDYQIVGTERLPFDDRDHARRALARRVRAGSG